MANSEKAKSNAATRRYLSIWFWVN